MCVPLSESLYVPDGGDLYHTTSGIGRSCLKPGGGDLSRAGT